MNVCSLSFYLNYFTIKDLFHQEQNLLELVTLEKPLRIYYKHSYFSNNQEIMILDNYHVKFYKLMAMKKFMFFRKLKKEFKFASLETHIDVQSTLQLTIFSNSKLS